MKEKRQPNEGGNDGDEDVEEEEPPQEEEKRVQSQTVRTTNLAQVTVPKHETD